MHLVQLFLPMTDNAGAALPRALFAGVRTTLVERFGGMTAHTRAPARGLWVENEAGDGSAAAPVVDELVIYEVVTDRLDRDWWAAYRAELESRFRQERLHVRATRLELL